MKLNLHMLFSNKVVLYMTTRYITYGLSFVVSMLLAQKMGPFYYGIWGFMMMNLVYFGLINFGIPQAIQVFLVQNKNNVQNSADYEKTGLLMMGGVSSICLLSMCYCLYGGFEIIHNNNMIFQYCVICICGVCNFFNIFYAKVYRTKNRIFELSFQQSSIVVLMLICVFFFQDETLFSALVASYFIALIGTMFLYVFGKGADYNGKFSTTLSKHILHKGFLLFLYNSGFYFIILSTQTMISNSFSVVEFGYFTFAYYIGHAVFQLLDAFASLVMAKLLYRYQSTNMDVVMSTIRIVRDNFVYMFHGVMYFAIIFIPLFLSIMPKYSGTLYLIILCCLTFLLFTNSFGYSTLLIARNKEKVLAMIAISALLLNISMGLILIYLIKVSYEYVIIATMITYVYYAIMCGYFGRKYIGLSSNFIDILKDCFPMGLLLPFIGSLIVLFLRKEVFVLLPIVIYVFLNIKVINSIYKTTIKLLKNPKLIDV